MKLTQNQQDLLNDLLFTNFEECDANFNLNQMREILETAKALKLKTDYFEERLQEIDNGINEPEDFSTDVFESVASICRPH